MPDKPVPTNPPSSRVSDAPMPECKCEVEIRANGELLGNATDLCTYMPAP